MSENWPTWNGPTGRLFRPEPPRIHEVAPFEGLPWCRLFEKDDGPAEDDYHGVVRLGEAVMQPRCPLCQGELLPRMLADGPGYWCHCPRNLPHEPNRYSLLLRASA